MICVVDYGMGNLKSVSNALEYLEIPYTISNNEEDIIQSTAILIPGVGAFYDAMQNLKRNGLDRAIIREAKNLKPVLGICLGMQVLFEVGEEVKETEGLGLIKGRIKYLDIDLKVPHIGWNRICVDKKNELISEEGYVYYVHSYYAETSDDVVLSYSDYGIKIPAIVKKDNIYGMQFHPEKSGGFGLQLLKKFWEEVNQ